LLLAGLAHSSFGAAITSGSFDISGTVFVTAAGANPVVTPAGTCAAATACIFWEDPTGTVIDKVDISSVNDTAGVTFGNDAANIYPLTNPPEVVGTFSPMLFMDGFGGSVTSLLINKIDPGIYTSVNCGSSGLFSGATCTLPNSPFNFVNNPPPTPAGTPCGTQCQATASWVFEGVTAGNPGTQSTWVGNFTSQFPLGTTYQAVLAQLAANGFVSNTYSATITLTPTAPVPEPGTMGMTIGAALIGLGVGMRRLSTKKRSASAA